LRNRQPAGRTGQETSVGLHARLLTIWTGWCPKDTVGAYRRRHRWYRGCGWNNLLPSRAWPSMR